MSNKKKEKIKLDQLMKIMFKLSKRVTLNLLNGLFDENYTYRDTKIHYLNNEFILESLQKIYGDMYIRVKSTDKVVTYHIEFQTQNDNSMSVRMFRYAFEKAAESVDYEEDKIRLDFPKQLVIFLEENRNIKDNVSFLLRMPDGNELEYKVPTMKYWEYSEQDLINKKMYALLPFQIFKFRKNIESILNSNKTHEQQAQLVNLEFDKLIKIIDSIGKISSELYKTKEIIGTDFEKILLVLNNISSYLYNKYGKDKDFEKEVTNMLTTLYNPVVVKKEVQKELKKEVQKEVQKEVRKELLDVAKTALEKGAEVKFVAEITKLDIEVVKKIQAELQGNKKE